MSALSDLEKALGLKPMDIDMVSMGSSRDFEKELYNVANKSIDLYEKRREQSLKTQATETFSRKETFEHQATLPLGNYAGYDPYFTPSKFDPVKVGANLGIGTAKASNLFTEVTAMYRATKNEKAKEICNKILSGLYNNTLNRVQCNDLINDLNNLARE